MPASVFFLALAAGKMGEEKDLPPGRKLVEYFTPFLLDLAASGLSKVSVWRPPSRRIRQRGA
jgi:hypothetical protein